MSRFYSASTAGFYNPDEFPHIAVPADAVAVADDQYEALLAAQTEGKTFALDDQGAVAAVDRPAPTPEQQWALVRLDRDARLQAAVDRLDRHRNQKDFGLATTLTDDQATAWAVYAQALRDLPETDADPFNVAWPEPPAD